MEDLVKSMEFTLDTLKNYDPKSMIGKLWVKRAKAINKILVSQGNNAYVGKI